MLSPNAVAIVLLTSPGYFRPFIGALFLLRRDGDLEISHLTDRDRYPSPSISFACYNFWYFTLIRVCLQMAGRKQKGILKPNCSGCYGDDDGGDAASESQLMTSGQHERRMLGYEE